MKLTKTTVLDGYYATGDCEAFVFDKCRGWDEHTAPMREWRNAHLDSLDGEEMPEALWDDHCRTYPNALLPEGSDGRKGRWVITIEFEELP